MNRFPLTFILVLICFFIVGEEAFSWSLPLVVDVVSIQFNYEGGSSNDALPIRKNASQTIDTPEWLPSAGRNNTFAYTKGQTNRKIQVVLHHNQTILQISSLHVKTLGGGYHPGLVAETQVNFPLFGNQTTVILTMSGGAVPNYVQFWGFYYYWQVTKVNGIMQNPIINFGQTGGHNYYTLLGTPQTPMSIPWTDVLNYACVWAANQATELGVVTKITQNAYTVFGQNHTYDGNRTHAVYPSFDLTGFMANNWADCRDMSAVVNVFARAIGCPNAKAKRIEGGFYHDSIIPIGNSDSIPPAPWGFHQVGWLSNVFDACIKLISGGTRIPVNENINGGYRWDLLYYDDGREPWNPGGDLNYSTIN